MYGVVIGYGHHCPMALWSWYDLTHIVALPQLSSGLWIQWIGPWETKDLVQLLLCLPLSYESILVNNYVVKIGPDCRVQPEAIVRFLKCVAFCLGPKRQKPVPNKTSVGLQWGTENLLKLNPKLVSLGKAGKLRLESRPSLLRLTSILLCAEKLPRAHDVSLFGSVSLCLCCSVWRLWPTTSI
ncbi:hypothetical protein E2542_SST18414 [Spatholobus suberectus]|nr:hypothetical protein E2542_SST18414 [Spatholobus suberectus]